MNCSKIRICPCLDYAFWRVGEFREPLIERNVLILVHNLKEFHTQLYLFLNPFADYYQLKTCISKNGLSISALIIITDVFYFYLMSCITYFVTAYYKMYYPRKILRFFELHH